MLCNINELRNKQVVSIKNGRVIGFLSDLDIDTENGNIRNLVVYGKPRAFGFFGREEDIVIPWEKTEVIGKETILVDDDIIN